MKSVKKVISQLTSGQKEDLLTQFLLKRKRARLFKEKIPKGYWSAEEDKRRNEKNGKHKSTD